MENSTKEIKNSIEICAYLGDKQSLNEKTQDMIRMVLGSFYRLKVLIEYNRISAKKTFEDCIWEANPVIHFIRSDNPKDIDGLEQLRINNIALNESEINTSLYRDMQRTSNFLLDEVKRCLLKTAQKKDVQQRELDYCYFASIYGTLARCVGSVITAKRLPFKKSGPKGPSQKRAKRRNEYLKKYLAFKKDKRIKSNKTKAAFRDYLQLHGDPISQESIYSYFKDVEEVIKTIESGNEQAETALITAGQRELIEIAKEYIAAGYQVKNNY